MRSTTLKLIILLSTILIGLLVSAQLFWLNKIYKYDQKEFTTSVVKSIKAVYEDLQLSDSPGPALQKLIEQPDINTFIFRIDTIPPKDTLQKTLLNNLEEFGVFTDCKVALYNDTTHSYAYEVYNDSTVFSRNVADSEKRSLGIA
jgi:hypothetical protein